MKEELTTAFNPTDNHGNYIEYKTENYTCNEKVKRMKNFHKVKPKKQSNKNLFTYFAT